MTAIGLVLAIKIGVTAVFIAAPFLFMPERRLVAMLGVSSGGPILRLYGVAILALLTGYASGFGTIAQGQFPWSVAAMGIVSNGGAALVLFLSGAWRRMRLIGTFVAGVAVALILAVLSSSQALVPLW